MKEKKITLSGKEYPVDFNMKTILNFEEISGTTFFVETFTTLKSRIALVMASVLTADENTDLTLEVMMGGKDVQAVRDVIQAYLSVNALASKFFEIPEAEKQNQPEQPEDAEADEKPKN